MYAITAITGKVGGAVAKTLLEAHLPVRAVVRDAHKGMTWTQRGCEMAVAEMGDTGALATAFQGAEAVFVLLPPVFDPSPGFPEAAATITAIRAAIASALPERVVCLSTIGAQARETNLLTQLGMMEKALADLPMPVTFLRPAWFMENASWDVKPAKETGVIPSFLQPLDKIFPMVATADVGKMAAELLQENWTGKRIIELEGPTRIAPNQIAATFGELLNKPVRMEAVPRAQWEAIFKSTGMTHPMPRMRMIDGFNEGWIDFEMGPSGIRKGIVELKTVLRDLVDAG